MNTAKMTIRSAQARDLDACLLLDASYETEHVWQMESSRAGGVLSTSFRLTRLPRSIRVTMAPSREVLLEHFEQGDCFLVAEQDGELRGFLEATVDRWKQLMWINHLTVRHEQRRHGVGSSLVRAALAWAREQGVATALVEMQTKNHPAAALFQKQGFTYCGFNERSSSSRDISMFFALDLR